jgi:hypothetical protein
MFVSYQVEDAMNQKQIQLLIQLGTFLGRLFFRRLRTDHHVPKPTRMERFPASLPLCEGQNICRMISPQILPIQLLDPSIAHEQDREFRFFEAEGFQHKIRDTPKALAVDRDLSLPVRDKYLSALGQSAPYPFPFRAHFRPRPRSTTAPAPDIVASDKGLPPIS